MENIEAMLCAYIEGDLDPAGVAEIEKHLEANPQHRKLISELIATRNMVRNLPRVSAPLDVGESLRGQVERSILLDDSAPRAVKSGMRINRWPQFAAVAAVFVLTAGLGVVIFKMVMPTHEAPKFTQKTLDQPLSQVERDESKAKAVAESAPLPVLRPATAKDAGPLAAVAEESNHPTALQKNAPPVVATDARANLDSINSELMKFGYAAAAKDRADQNSTVIMVIDSADPTTANDKMTRFFKTNNITCTRLPEPAATQPAPEVIVRFDGGATSQPAGAIAVGGVASAPAARNGEDDAISKGLAQRDINDNAFRGAGLLGGGGGAGGGRAAYARQSGATQPSAENFKYQQAAQDSIFLNQDVYIAHNMTQQQTEELRAALGDKGGEVQVYSSAPKALSQPTTQPNEPSAVAIIPQTQPTDVEAAAHTVNSAVAPQAAPAADAPVSIGDTLVVHATDLTTPEGEQVQSLRVNEEGKLTPAGLPPVDAAGNTTHQLEETIASDYDRAKMSINARVTVHKLGAKADKAEQPMDVVIVIQNGAATGKATGNLDSLPPAAAATQPAAK